MKLAKKTLLVIFFSCLIITFLTSCDKKNPDLKTKNGKISLNVTFLFDSAQNIKKGSFIEHKGVRIGKVISNPEFTPDGKSIKIDAIINGLPNSFSNVINSYTTVNIQKTSIVDVGNDKVIKIYFSSLAAPPIASGGIITGCNNWVELQTWKVIYQPKVSKGAFNNFMGLLFETNKNKTGDLIYWLNIICFLSLVIVVLILILDLFLRIFQGKQRTKPSPVLFVKLWRWFMFWSIIKILVLIATIICILGRFSLPSYPPYIIWPSSPIEVLRWDWAFYTIFVVIVGIKYKMNLLTLLVFKNKI